MNRPLKVLSFVHDDFEDLELWYPILRLKEEDVEVHLVGEKAEEKYKGKYGVPAQADYSFLNIDYQNYDGLLLPGGWASDKLRRFPEVLQIIRHMNEQRKPIGHICHGGWLLISAGILKGINVTSTKGIKDDMENAGAIWVDKPVVVDGNIVSSRKPADLPQYMKAYIALLLKQQ